MDDLLTTPLYDLHLELGGKMVPFAGYSLPVQYPAGVMAEHQHCRAQTGLFDVSHMGQVWIEGPSWEAVALGVEALVPQDVLGLADGRQRYGFLTSETGGILDDLMMSRSGERLFVVVNGACKAADFEHLQSHLPTGVTARMDVDRALVALQGPAAESALARLAPAVAEMRFMDVRHLEIDGAEIWVSRSGYTGEDGFELSIPADRAEAVCRSLLEMGEVAPIGLGARDSLRLEAGLCLYGQDMNAGLNPVEASLSWAIQKVRRTGGARAGGFPGADIILDALDNGVHRHRVGLLPEGRAPMRRAVPLFKKETGGSQIGFVSSGGFGPTFGAPVAMGIVADSLHTPGTRLFGEVRGKRLPVQVAKLPFVPAQYKR